MKKQDKLELTVKEIEYFIEREQKRLDATKPAPFEKTVDPVDIARKSGKIIGLKMALVLAKTNAGIIKPMK
jgi:hypothetical protein